MNDNRARTDDTANGRPSKRISPAHPAPGTSLGDRFRNLVNPAMDDLRRQPTQLKMLDEIFATIAPRLEGVLMRSLNDVFNQAALSENSGGDAKRNMFMIEKMSEHDGMSSMFRLGIPMSTAFTDFSAADVKELPGYIALHEKARELNVAIKVSNLTAEEGKSPSGPQPAYIIIDMTKTYDEGAIENSHMYPQLPEIKPKFERNTGGGFSF